MAVGQNVPIVDDSCDILIEGGLPLSDFHTLKPTLLSDCPATSRAALKCLQRQCQIHILEVGFHSDATHFDCVARKKSQHQQLVSLLLAAGWSIHSSLPAAPLTPVTLATVPLPPPLPPDSALPEWLRGWGPRFPLRDILHFGHLHPTPPVPDLSHFVHIILFSTSGIIYSPIQNILTLLGVPRPALNALLNKLHARTVSYVFSLVCLRRGLEHLPYPSHTRPTLTLSVSEGMYGLKPCIP